MSSATTPKFWHLLAFRLSLLYAGVLAISSLLCFSVFYAAMISTMRAHTDANLLHLAQRLSDVRARGGMPAVTVEMVKASEGIGTKDIFLRIVDRSGTQLTSSDLAGWADMLTNSAAIHSGITEPVFEDWYGIGRHGWVRVVRTPFDEGAILQIGYSMQDYGLVPAEFRRVAGMVLLGAVAIAVAAGWFMARRTLAGVQTIMTTARQISQGELTRRVPISGRGDEIDQWASTFNRMLERIESLVKGMEETNDNIAHELRSPIARIRGQAETTLTGNGSLDGYREMAASTVEECDRLLAMINTMLDIAEAEAGVMSLKMSSVDVHALLRDISEIYEPMTAEKNIRVSVEANGSLVIRGDVQRLQRMIANLVDNAVKYTPRGGTIRLSAHLTDGQAELSVANTGEGILPDKLPHIFQRFYRADASRSGSGYGLGLSLAQAIVHAHGGQISVRSISGDKTTFYVVLPATIEPIHQPTPK